MVFQVFQRKKENILWYRQRGRAALLSGDRDGRWGRGGGGGKEEEKTLTCSSMILNGVRDVHRFNFRRFQSRTHWKSFPWISNDAVNTLTTFQWCDQLWLSAIHRCQKVVDCAAISSGCICACDWWYKQADE